MSRPYGSFPINIIKDDRFCHSTPVNVAAKLLPLSHTTHGSDDLIANHEKQHAMTGGKLYVDWQGLEARFRDRTRRFARTRAA